MVDAYVQAIHGDWLNDLDTYINAATNPYTGLTPYDPAQDIAAMVLAISTFQASIANIDPDGDVGSAYAAAISLIDTYLISDTYISDRISAHSDDLDVEINAKVLPRFEAGMRDINAVQTSAFAIGRAIIEKDRNDKVDKFAADIRFQVQEKRVSIAVNLMSEISRYYLQKKEYERAAMAIILDEKRLALSAMSDYKTENKAILSDAAKWPMEKYKSGANMIASVTGGTTSSTSMDGNKTARVISTALSGAVAGSLVGNMISSDSGSSYGAMIGGMLGIMGGL